MTSHGFGKGTIRSSAKATIDDARAIAKKIAKIRAPNNTKVVRKAHLYKLKDEDDYKILFEFTHLRDIPGYTLEDLKDAVNKVDHEGHRLHDTDYWIIAESYQ